jgi:hypothetical protein
LPRPRSDLHALNPSAAALIAVPSQAAAFTDYHPASRRRDTQVKQVVPSFTGSDPAEPDRLLYCGRHRVGEVIVYIGAQRAEPAHKFIEIWCASNKRLRPILIQRMPGSKLAQARTVAIG